MSRWFRHYAGLMRDDKLVRVAIKSRQTIERVTWIWGAILESAAEIDDDGRYDVDAAEIAYFLRSDEGDISAVLDALADAERVAGGRVVHWGDRQFTSDRSAARVAAHRQRKRAENGGTEVTQESGNVDVTLQERHCNSPETETETETETEGSGAKAPSPARKRVADPFPKPDWCSDALWSDLKANRKAKRLPNTATAHAKLIRDLEALADDEWPPGRLLEAIVARGWAAAYDPRETRNGQPTRISSISQPAGTRGTRPDPCLDMLRTAQQAIDSAGDPQAGLGTWPALPAIGTG